MTSENHQPGDSSTGLSSYELKAVGGAAGLLLLNTLVMFLLVLTPFADLNAQLFTIPVIGVLVYGAFLIAGEWYAERSLRNGNKLGALLGVGILQLTYGAFGSGVLAVLPRDMQLPALGVTLILTVGLTAVLASYVYLRDADFDHWGTYANVAFLGGVGLAFLGSFMGPILLLTFVSIFLGFILKFGWEIWRVREEMHEPDVAAIGIYVAATGVFVHILQMVVRMFLQSE